jgi:hypothetical protein
MGDSAETLKVFAVAVLRKVAAQACWVAFLEEMQLVNARSR